MDHGLLLRPSANASIIIAYSDADWASYKDTFRSTTGYAVYFGPNLIVWHSKKQTMVSKASTKAEYRALDYTVTETIWLRKLLFHVGISLTTPTRLHCDSVSETYMTSNPI